MKMRINNWQLYCLMMLFEIGSTTVFGLGIDAKQDAWIAVLLAMFFGFVLIWIYTEIQKYYPEKNLAEILISVLGKWLAIPIILLYALEFFWISTLNFREFGELISMILLPSVPLSVILVVFMITAMYTLFLGFEVLARLGELMFPLIIFFILSIFVLIGFSEQVDLTRLQPVLGNGITPVLKAAIPALVNFPFGEMVVFLMYWHYVNEKQCIRKTSFFVTITIGLLLSSVLALMVAVLDVPFVTNSTIPIYEVIKLINIGDILTNLDSLATVVQFIGGFFKMTIHFYGGVLAVKSLFKIINEKWLIALFGVFWTWFSIVYYPNLLFHRWVGLKISISYFYSGFTVLEIVCPSLLLIIIILKNKLHKQSIQQQCI
ncbi:GerAB/ArcD/ProY family transporter [Pelosinus sp. UFO1]|uniref:GerAB/ArcD/ProY family transporter n=1 Tax=Pelosinus sp. UFO1 TaxID=484770 RepID=UPI0004D12940|nr:GerAB/ArcD/ProY family transporter [Pelosinus sp. UFO1]AIF53198.1 spore germination protein [Pelosinus sp. UFO1]